jgi:membrane-bound lytic murein transglycosylase
LVAAPLPLMRESARLRTEITADLRPEIEATPVEDRGAILSYLADRVQAIFDAQGSPKVTFTGGCAGAEGGGIRATEGEAFAGVCVTGSLSSGLTGGGVEAGFTY